MSRSAVRMTIAGVLAAAVTVIYFATRPPDLFVKASNCTELSDAVYQTSWTGMYQAQFDDTWSTARSRARELEGEALARGSLMEALLCESIGSTLDNVRDNYDANDYDPDEEYNDE